MHIFISSIAAFYKEEGEIFYLQAIFSVLRNNIEKLLKERVEKKDYGDGLEDISIMFICHPYRDDYEEEIKYRGKKGQSWTLLDARKFIDGTFIDRVNMMVDGIGRTVKEFHRIMKSRKTQREFNIEDFLKDLEEVRQEMFRIKEDLRTQVDNRVIREITKK